jgi:hypothetical protein
MVGAVTLALASATVFAQEPAERPDSVVQRPDSVMEDDEETARPAPKNRIRVLQHPYDLALFYRSEGSGFYDGASDRYPIASFYRSRQTSPYGQFWATGYGPAYGPGYGSGDRRGRSIFRRSIGENGDLFLFAPVLLAPVGPLSGAFLEPR